MLIPAVTELTTQTATLTPRVQAPAERPPGRRAGARRKTCTRADRIEAEVGRLLLLGKTGPRRT